MTSTLRTVWANPWVRRPVLFALAAGAALVVCYFILDHRGKVAWRAVQQEMAAEGETIEFRRLLPPDVPEAENFCAVGPLRNLAAPVSDHSPAGEEGGATGSGFGRCGRALGSSVRCRAKPG